jgi:hypothetical protein
MSDSMTSTPEDDLFDRIISGEVQLSAKELERRKQAAERLKEQLSSHPWYAEQAKKDPDFWMKLQDSQVNL